jgi:hypothetical protein
MLQQKDSFSPQAVMRFTARALSIVSTAVLLLFLVGEGFEPAKISPREWIGLLLFPTGVVIGFSIAWVRETLGGFVSVASLFGFYLLYIHRLNDAWAFAAFAFPGFLFVITGILSSISRKRIASATSH